MTTTTASVSATTLRRGWSVTTIESGNSGTRTIAVASANPRRFASAPRDSSLTPSTPASKYSLAFLSPPPHLTAVIPVSRNLFPPVSYFWRRWEKKWSFLHLFFTTFIQTMGKEWGFNSRSITKDNRNWFRNTQIDSCFSFRVRTITEWRESLFFSRCNSCSTCSKSRVPCSMCCIFSTMFAIPIPCSRV